MSAPKHDGWRVFVPACMANPPTLWLWDQLFAIAPNAALEIADLYRGELEQLRFEPGSTDYPALREAIRSARPF